MQSNFAEFYNSRSGKLASELLQKEISFLWPQIPTSEIIGLFGYAENYSAAFPAEAKKICLAPAHLSSSGILVDEKKLPLRDAELDRIFIIHSLENSELFEAIIPELWRVLKPSGKIILVIPNRKGWWIKKFGGKKLHKSEVRIVLLFNKFSMIKIRRAIFAPPALPFAVADKIGRIIFRPFCGAFVFEAEKLIYAPRGRTIKIVPSILEVIAKRTLRPAA